jgi:hypothetical protein
MSEHIKPLKARWGGLLEKLGYTRLEEDCSSQSLGAREVLCSVAYRKPGIGYDGVIIQQIREGNVEREACYVRGSAIGDLITSYLPAEGDLRTAQIQLNGKSIDVVEFMDVEELRKNLASLLLHPHVRVQ